MEEQSNQQVTDTDENSTSDIMTKYETLEKNYKNLQSDYTKKSQQLKELSTHSEDYNDGGDENTEQWKQWFKANLLDPELDRIRKTFTESKTFESILQSTPEIKPYEKAISDLVKSTGKWYEEVIQEYGFLSSDKLEKAKSRSLIWDREYWKKPKSIADMTSQEYTEWKKTHANGDLLQKSQSF